MLPFCLGCCGNFTNFPSVLKESLKGNYSQLHNAPAFFIPFRVNDTIPVALSQQQVQRPMAQQHPAKNQISGQFLSTASRNQPVGNTDPFGLNNPLTGNDRYDDNSLSASTFDNDRYTGNSFVGNGFGMDGSFDSYGGGSFRTGYGRRSSYGRRRSRFGRY